MLSLGYIRSSKKQKKISYANSYFHILIKDHADMTQSFPISVSSRSFQFELEGFELDDCSFNNFGYMPNIFNCFLFLKLLFVPVSCLEYSLLILFQYCTHRCMHTLAHTCTHIASDFFFYWWSTFLIIFYCGCFSYTYLLISLT